MWTDHLPFRSQIIGQRTSCSDNESMTLDDIGSCFIMVSKQEGPQWDLVVPWKRVLHGFVKLCSDHDLHESSISQEANGYSLLCLEFLHIFGPSVLLLQRRLLLMAPTFPLWPFELLSLLCWLRNTPASPTQKEASALYCKRLFSHRWPGVGRIIRKCHPFCELRSHWVAATAGRMHFRAFEANPLGCTGGWQ